MGTGNMEFDNVQIDVTFSQASERDNITSAENIALSFGKLSKWFEALVPEGGSSGQILGWNSSGTAKWINSPTIPTVNDGIFSIKKGSTNIVTFSANQSSNTDLSFVEGSNVTITPNSTNRTVTIGSADEKVKVDKFVSTTQTDYLLTGAVASMATTAAHLVVDNADGVASARMRLQKGTTDTIGQSMLMLGNNITSGTSNNMQGMILMYSSSNKYGKIVSESLTDDRTWTMPDKTGTIALTSDIPTVNNASLTLKGAGTTVTTFTANSSTNQSLDIVAGTNVTITPDATNHKITIASSYTNTDTKVKVTTSTSKAYLIGTTTSPDGTAVEGVGNTGVYMTNGVLTAAFAGALSGNATTSSSWATARTLTLGGQLTGSVSVKGDANMTLNGYLDRAFIYDDNAVPANHTWAEYAWHKFAEVTITDEFEDRVITFLVSRTHGSSAEYTGILSAKLRTKENKVYDSAQLKWLVRNYGLSKDDFVMVYTSTSGTSTKAELWCRLPSQYHGLVFTVLKEHRRNDSASSDWTLVKTPKGSSTHGSSSYPTTGITDTIISSDGIITNSTTGTATSANALNLTHDNELNFSKLASTGHVWFGYRWNTQGTETSGGTAITTYKFGNANGAGGLAGLEAGTATFKDADFGQQLIVERTTAGSMASVTFKNPSGILGYISANTVDGDLYHYGASDTSTMKYVILDSHNYTSYACGKVLFNTDTNSSDTISIVTANIPANTNHMTVIFKVSGSAAGVGKVYVASTIPYIRDVYLGGVLHVSTVSDDSGSVKLSLVPFTIQLTTSSTNTSVSLIHGTPVKIPGGTTPTDRSGFDIKIVKIIGGA